MPGKVSETYCSQANGHDDSTRHYPLCIKCMLKQNRVGQRMTILQCGSSGKKQTYQAGVGVCCCKACEVDVCFGVNCSAYCCHTKRLPVQVAQCLSVGLSCSSCGAQEQSSAAMLQGRNSHLELDLGNSRLDDFGRLQESSSATTATSFELCTQ